MTISNQTYRFYNQSTDYLQRLEGAGWRPEYGAVLGALKRYQLSKGGAALDYGCGVGDLTAILARTGYQAVGADISLPFVQSAQARHPHLPFVALDAGPMTPFASDQFWAIAAVNTIEHVATPAQTLRELHRVLAPGGLLVLTFPNLLSPLRPLKRFVARRRRARYGPESGDSAGQSLALLVRNTTSLLDSRLNQQPAFVPASLTSRTPSVIACWAMARTTTRCGCATHWTSPTTCVTWACTSCELRGIPGAAERSLSINHLRRALPASISSPILLAARKTY